MRNFIRDSVAAALQLAPAAMRERMAHARDLVHRLPTTLRSTRWLSDPDDILEDMSKPLTGRAISDAVTPLGWRLILNQIDTTVSVTSLAAALDVAARVVARCGADAEDHLRIDVRGDGVVFTMPPMPGWVTQRELELAAVISEVARTMGRETVPQGGSGRSVQAVEIAIDALDIDAVRPFWRAVMGYVDAADGSLYDPLGQSSGVWFQQMDERRDQRNRIHFDVSVPHDQAADRIKATLAAGGVLVSDAESPAFWIMADVEGNEVCICSWQGRDAGEVRADGSVV